MKYRIATYATLLGVVAVAVVFAGIGIATSRADVPMHTTTNLRFKAIKPEVPFWITRPCESRWDVNCRSDGKHPSVRRALPGKAHMVCEFFVDRKYARTHDYCA